MAVIGVNNLYYAVMIKDDNTGVSYGTPKRITGTIKISIDPKVNNTTLYADDQPLENATSIGEVSVDLNVADLSIDVLSDLLGHTVDGGVMLNKSPDVAPYVAIMFESLMSNGKRMFVKLLKGKFQVPKDEFATKDDKVTFGTPSISGTFVMRLFDGAWRKIAREDYSGYTSSIGANWYTSVESTDDITAPTVTTNPLDAASNVTASNAFVWTFSKAIRANTVTPANFMLIKASDGTAVSGSLSADSTGKIITFTPTGNLAAATAYIAIATTNIKSLAGVALSANSITNFTTA